MTFLPLLLRFTFFSTLKFNLLHLLLFKEFTHPIDFIHLLQLVYRMQRIAPNRGDALELPKYSNI